MVTPTAAQKSFEKKDRWNEPLDLFVLGTEGRAIHEVEHLGKIPRAERLIIIEEAEVLKMKFEEIQVPRLNPMARPMTFERFSKGVEVGLICAAVSGVMFTRLGWYGVAVAFVLGFLLGLYSVRTPSRNRI